MRLFRSGLGGRAEADGGPAGDQAWTFGFLRALDRGGDRLGIVTVDAARGPAGRFKALHLIDRVGKRQRAVDRDAIVVKQHDQSVELQVAGERDGFLADALHQVAVGREHIGAVVDDIAAELGGQVGFGDSHADGIGEALAERAGGRFDAGRVVVFRMAGGDRAQLAKALELVDRHRLIADKMQQRIEQHRAVARRQHEAVAVRPGRIGGIELQEPSEQHSRDIGGAHRQAGVA